MNPPSVYLEVSITHSFLVLFFFLDSYLKYDYAIFRREYVQFLKLSHKNVTDPLPTIPQIPGLKRGAYRNKPVCQTRYIQNPLAVNLLSHRAVVVNSL